MFSAQLSQLLALRNQNLDGAQLRSMLDQIEKPNKIELMALIELYQQFCQNKCNDVKQHEIINEMREWLSQQFSANGLGINNTNNFIEYKNKFNEKNIGIAILNNKGEFILTDQISRIILELNTSEDLASKTLFSLMCLPSQEKLRQEMKHCCLIPNDKEKQTFTITIYSDRNRKKSLKYLNQIAQAPIKKKKTQNQKEIKPMSNEQLLMIKYLKSIHINVMKVNFQFGKGFIEAFQESDDIKLSNLNTNQSNQFVLCEIKELDEYENFNYEDLLRDPYILKHENKWYNRVRKFRGQTSDDDID